MFTKRYDELESINIVSAAEVAQPISDDASDADDQRADKAERLAAL